ncbi:hypothetical protein EB118_11690 [bacterium]|nr:hypothetical protein [bacterium]NDC94902.1 hypothetical protein [bacterium]NDD84640.1 hypothetical protein [bacterium]NDG30721.1 hypothetical protein [bacterium]
MKLPMEVIEHIEGFLDPMSKVTLLYLCKSIYRFLLPKYLGIVLYSNSSNLVYDSYKMTIHKSEKDLRTYINNTPNELPVIYKRVQFTPFGRHVANMFKSRRIHDLNIYVNKLQ